MSVLTEEERQQLEELTRERDAKNREAYKLRDKRDGLNQNTKDWAQKRDKLNGEVRELVDKANEHRSKRDELNKKVQEAKKERDELNKVASDAKAKFDDLRRESQNPEGPSLGRLKKQMQKLEYEQMTKVLSPKKEKELIETLQDLSKQIKERERAFEDDSALKEAWEEYRSARDKAEEAHKRVQEHAELAQREHDAMVSLFEQADKLRKEADECQVEFVKSKTTADEVHANFIEVVNEVRDLDKVIVSIKSKERKAKKQETVAEAKAEADQVYERFLAGDKLSTDDLLVLQKAGKL